MTNTQIMAPKLNSPSHLAGESRSDLDLAILSDTGEEQFLSSSTEPARNRIEPAHPSQWYMLIPLGDTERSASGRSRMSRHSLEEYLVDFVDASTLQSLMRPQEFASANGSAPDVGRFSISGSYPARAVVRPFVGKGVDLDIQEGIGVGFGNSRDLIVSGATDRMSHLFSYRFRDLVETAFVEYSDAVTIRRLDVKRGLTSANESVARVDFTRQVTEKLEQSIIAAQDEEFEAGMESEFSRSLDDCFDLQAEALVLSIRKKISEPKLSAEICAEMLRWVSRQEATGTRELALGTLVIGLSHRSSLVRDAAALGLAEFDETLAQPYLRDAWERETVPEFREDLKDLIDSLGE